MLKQALTNKEVSTILQEVALLLELKGESPFKVKAYSHAARSIELLEEDLGIFIRENRLREMKGIGQTLAQHITEIVTTGTVQLHEDLKTSIPPGHLEMLKIPGLGPKKVKTLYDRLDIKTIGELEYACSKIDWWISQDSVEKSQEKILQGIQQVKKYQGQYLYGEVIRPARKFLKRFSPIPELLEEFRWLPEKKDGSGEEY